MVINKENTTAMYNLGVYYKEIENNDNEMYKYLWLALEKNHKKINIIFSKIL